MTKLYTLLGYVFWQTNKDFWLRLGAQEMPISVCPSVPSLSEVLNLHLFGSDSLQEHSERIKQEFREHSESTQKALRRHSENTQISSQREGEQSDFVMPSDFKPFLGSSSDFKPFLG